MKTSRKQRKAKRIKLLDAQRERRAATRSKYGAKRWAAEHGAPPNPEAESKARRVQKQTP
jgi:hypothetical protein